MRLYRYCFILLCTSLQLSALESIDRDITLAPTAPEKSEIFGITFGDNIHKVSDTMLRMGMKLQEREFKGPSDNVVQMTFSGTPSHLPVKDGTSELFFVDGKLARIDFLFPPTYRNFLVMRQQLLGSLGKRFKVGQKQEVMDSRLRTRLAHLGKNGFGQQSEKAVRTALLKGSTFFFYDLADRQQELNVTYSYHTAMRDAGTREPELRLHYSLRSVMNSIKQHQSQSKRDQRSVLP